MVGLFFFPTTRVSSIYYLVLLKGLLKVQGGKKKGCTKKNPKLLPLTCFPILIFSLKFSTTHTNNDKTEIDIRLTLQNCSSFLFIVQLHYFPSACILAITGDLSFTCLIICSVLKQDYIILIDCPLTPPWQINLF